MKSINGESALEFQLKGIKYVGIGALVGGAISIGVSEMYVLEFIQNHYNNGEELDMYGKLATTLFSGSIGTSIGAGLGLYKFIKDRL